MPFDCKFHHQGKYIGSNMTNIQQIQNSHYSKYDSTWIGIRPDPLAPHRIQCDQKSRGSAPAMICIWNYRDFIFTSKIIEFNNKSHQKYFFFLFTWGRYFGGIHEVKQSGVNPFKWEFHKLLFVLDKNWLWKNLIFKNYVDQNQLSTAPL